MEKVMLKDLNMKSRSEVMVFLKKLWGQEITACPICGENLEILHNKAKKNDCDWQCKRCGKVFRTMHLLDELNEKMPK